MKKTNLSLVFFILMNFVVSMTASVFTGILDQVAVSLNISIASSGLLNAMYSYGAAIGVPVTLIVFKKIKRTKMLKIMLLVTILMTFALIFAQNFTQLLIARLVMGISANSYGVLAISVVIALSAKERQGRSMAFLIMGSSLALVIGIPLTRVVSAIFDWRSIFWMLNVIMILSLLYFSFYLPEGDQESSELNFKNELNFFTDRKILSLITYTLMMFIGYGAFYTYSTPYLLHEFPSTETAMSLILIFLGIASFMGNLIGGYAADKIGYDKSLILGGMFQMVSMLLVFLFHSFMGFSVFFCLLWIMGAWFTGLQINTGIVQLTRNQSSFMISIISSMIQLGCAIGASLAAFVISKSGIQNIVFITILTALGIVLIQLFVIKKHQSNESTSILKV